MSTVQANRLPNNVVLFSGHMIDAPDRKAPRFPPGKASIAAAAIADALAQIGAAAGDLAIMRRNPKSKKFARSQPPRPVTTDWPSPNSRR